MVNLTAKKIYCAKCQKLVRVKMQHTSGKNQFNCIKCDSVIWQKEPTKWKYVKEE